MNHIVAVDQDLPDRYAALRESIIRIEHLSKIFHPNSGPVTAVDDITFDVKRGEIFGLLGPNGAGKSTLIRILTTLISPLPGRRLSMTVRGITRIPRGSADHRGLPAEQYARSGTHRLRQPGVLRQVAEDVDDRVLKPRIWELLEMVGLMDRAR